jgi:WD40 repeat protein
MSLEGAGGIGAREPSGDPRLDDVVAEYLEARRCGNAPAAEDLLARHPDLAPRLRSFLSDMEALRWTDAGRGGGGGPLGVPALGERIGDYEILEEIGRGGMGVVFRARQAGVGREVALKVVLAGRLASAVEVERFRREVEAAGHLDHPNIVAVHEAGEHRGIPFFSMRLVDGGSLAGRLGEFRSRPRDAARLVEILARAIHHAHGRGVLHRDLKPANILLDSRGDPHITDFGLARLLERDESLTRTGAFVGTPGYVAPEILRGQGKASAAVDVYGLGAILYSLLTGGPPFHAPTPIETIEHVKTAEPVRPRHLNPSADRDLETICLRCLEKEPARRYPSAEALAEDLARYLRGEPIAARPAGAAEKAFKWARRKPAWAALAASTFLGTVTLIVVLAVSGANLGKALDATLREQALSRRYLHNAEMNLALAAWGEGRLDRMDLLLEAHRPRPGEEDLRGFEWFHLKRRTLSCFREIREPQKIGAIAFHPDGRSFASGSDGGTIKVRETATGNVLRTFSWGERSIGAMKYSPDGSRIALVSTISAGRPGGDLAVIDAVSGKAILEREAPEGGAIGAEFNHDGKLLAVTGGHIRIWDIASGSTVGVLEKGGAFTCAIFTDWEAITCGSWDGSIRRWEFRKSSEASVIDASWSGISTVAAFNGGLYIGAGYMEIPLVRIWLNDGKGGAMAFRAPRNSRLITSESDLTDAAYPLTVAGGGELLVWDIATGRLLASVRSENDDFSSSALSPDGKVLISPDRKAGIRLWSMRDLQEPLVLREGEEIDSIAFSPDGRKLAVGRRSGKVRLWDTEGFRTETTIDGQPPGSMVMAVAFGPDGTILATGGTAGTARLLDLRTGKEVRSLGGHQGSIRQAAFDPRRAVLAVASFRKVRIWSLEDGSLLREIQAHEDRVYDAAFSPDGRLLATCGAEGTVKLWDAGTWAEIRNLHRTGGEEILCLAFSPDGKILASGTAAGKIPVWDPASGRELGVCLGHTSRVNRLAFTPDGRSLISCGGDRTVKIWDPVVFQEKLTLPAGEKNLNAVAVSPDGRLVAAGGIEGHVFVWRAAGEEGEGREVLQEKEPTEEAADLPESRAGPEDSVWIDVAQEPLGGPGGCNAGAWGDYDGDGDIDLYLASSGPNRLLRNERDGSFSDATRGPLGDPGISFAAAWSDFDGDGDLDLAVANRDGGSKLLRNDGGADFTDATAAALLRDDEGLTALTWVDPDCDGRPDLFAVCPGRPARILRNEGEGNLAPLAVPWGASPCQFGAWGDFDGDGSDDLFLGISKGDDRLFRGMGSETFAEVPLKDLFHLASWADSKGAAWGDFDGDGLPDLFIAIDGEKNRLLRNRGGGTFEPCEAGWVGIHGSAASWADHDGDGLLDLLVVLRGKETWRSHLLKNEGGTSFRRAPGWPWKATEDHKGGAWGDFDGDGDLDIFIANWAGVNKLLRNDRPTGGRWLHVDLEGAAPGHSALGARVTLSAGGRIQVRDVGSAGCGGSQDSLTVEFGLGRADRIDLLEVRWPSGTVQKVPIEGADRRIRVREEAPGAQD